jgi:hypothetical protein
MKVKETTTKLQKIEWGKDYYCPNCGKVNGKTRYDDMDIWVCAEKVKGDKYPGGCSNTIRKEEKHNWKGLELVKEIKS